MPDQCEQTPSCARQWSVISARFCEHRRRVRPGDARPLSCRCGRGGSCSRRGRRRGGGAGWSSRGVEAAKVGRQHSSRIVRWSRSTWPLVCGRPSGCGCGERRTIALPKGRPRNSAPLSVSTRWNCQPGAVSPAGGAHPLSDRRPERFLKSAKQPSDGGAHIVGEDPMVPRHGSRVTVTCHHSSPLHREESDSASTPARRRASLRLVPNPGTQAPPRPKSHLPQNDETPVFTGVSFRWS